MLEGNAGVIMDMSIWAHQGQNVLLTAGMCGHIKVWTLAADGASNVEFDHDLSTRGGVFTIAVVANNAGTSLLLSGHNDGAVLVHELPTFLDRGQLCQAHAAQVWALQPVPPGWVCTGAMDQTVKLWQWVDGQ